MTCMVGSLTNKAQRPDTGERSTATRAGWSGFGSNRNGHVGLPRKTSQIAFHKGDVDEFIFQANGSYSSMTKCSNGYMYYESGRWEVVGNGVIHCYIDNWEPKVFAGNVIRANPGKTFSYRFLDYNTMQTPDLTLTRVR